MTRARLVSLLSLVLLLPACATPEPERGCLLAAANQREALRYLHPAIPARLLCLYGPRPQDKHVALVFRLEPEGWCLYDDNYGTRHLAVPRTREWPAPLDAGRAGFPTWPIVNAGWLPGTVR